MASVSSLKNRGHTRAFSVIPFILSIFIACSVNAEDDDFSAPKDSDRTTREQKREELLLLRKRMEKIQELIRNKQQEKNSATKGLQEIELKINRSVVTLKKLKRSLTQQNHALSKLKKEKVDIERKLASQRTILAKQIKAAYMIGRQEYLKLLLNQENPAAVGRTLTYYDYFHKARNHNIKQAKLTIAELDNLKQKIDLKSKQLKVSLAKQNAEKEILEENYISRATLINELEKEISDKSKYLVTLKENEELLRQIVNEIQTIMPSLLTDIDKRKTFARQRGQLGWPVKGKIEKLFGKSRQAANIKWNGVIISSAEGKEVKAVSHGRVAYADWLRGYGMLIIIDHGEGYMTLYGHNQALYKETGDWVEAGDVIATVGKSGGYAESGLYFEIRNNGQPSNPVSWFKRKS